MGISITIPPVTIVLIVIVISNWIISFGKSNLMIKCYVILSSILSIVGIVGMIIVRPWFISSLNTNSSRREFDSEFVAWAIEKFDSYAFISIIATCIIIIVLLFLLFLNKKERGFAWGNITAVVILFIVINFVAVVWHTIGAINKLFDIAGYISQLFIAEFFAMNIPLTVKRILIPKEYSLEHERKQ